MNPRPVSLDHRMRRTCAAVMTAVLTGLVASPRPAQAVDDVSERTPPPRRAPRPSPVVEACISHHVSAQELRLSGKLLESQKEMRACAAEACPVLLQGDCVNWLGQLETQIPSITFRATVDGVSRTDGQVFIDGVAHPELMSGKSVELDPGKHRLYFVVNGVAPFEEEFVCSEGERYRMVEVVLSSPSRAAPELEAHLLETHRPVPVASYVLGGVAAAAAISGGIWGVSSLSLRRELEDTCAPACPDRRVDELRRRALFADLSWGVSAAAAVGAATVFLLRPELPIEVEASWLPGGGLARLRLDAF
jgi:hypothetical protein